jgi:Ca2+-binding EF-hand superfamily protein
MLTAGLAAAQDQGLSEGHLDAADTSGDGALSLDEFRAYMNNAFDAIDGDGNGVVTWTEAQAAIAREHFDAIDANKDGNVTAGEMDAQAQADFAASDLDGDGALN